MESTKKYSVTVLIPTYNEEGSIDELYGRLTEMLDWHYWQEQGYRF